jgi:hypothetical protein
MAMTLEIFKAFPPDSEGPVAQISVHHDGVVDIPAEIRRDNGELRITMFAREGGVAWDYPLADFLAVVHKGVEALASG